MSAESNQEEDQDQNFQVLGQDNQQQDDLNIDEQNIENQQQNEEQNYQESSDNWIQQQEKDEQFQHNNQINEQISDEKDQQLQDQQQQKTSIQQGKKETTKEQNKSKKEEVSNKFDYVSQKVLNTISESQLKQQNQETIEDAYKQRKRQSFNVLKEWDSQRDEFIKNHKKVAFQILENVNEKVNLSETVIRKILVFFEKIRAIQFGNFKQLKENTPTLQINNEKKAKNQKNKKEDQEEDKKDNNMWYPDLAKSIQKMDQVFENQIQKIQEFVEFIDVNILKEIQVNIKKYRGKMLEHRKDLKAKFTNIQKFEEKVKVKFLKYAKVFQEAVDSKQKNRKDLYNWEIKYRQEIKGYFQCFQDYGKQVFDYWMDMKQFEMERLECIKKVFSIYVERNLKVYGVVENLSMILGEFQNFDNKNQGEKMFDVSEVLSQEQIDFVNQGKSANITTEESIQNFLFKFKFPEIESFDNGQHRLILKKYEGLLDIGTFGLKWLSIELIFTIDDFLHFFEKGQNKPSKVKMDCKNIRFQQRKKNNKLGNLCYIIEKSPGTIYSSERKFLVKFKDHDSLLEFQIYLKRYGVESEIFEDDIQ